MESVQTAIGTHPKGSENGQIRKEGQELKHEHKRYIKIGITVFVLFLLMYYWSRIESAGLTLLYAVTPLVGGFVVAYILNIPMSFFERVLFGKCKSAAAARIKRPLCMLLSAAAVTALIFLIVTLIVPELVSCLKLIVRELPPILEDWYNTLEERYGFSGLLEENFRKTFGENADWQDIAKKAMDFVINGLGGVMGSVFTFISAVFSTVFSVFVSLVFAAYLLNGKERLTAGLNRLLRTYLKPRVRAGCGRGVSVFDDCFHRFIVGQCTEAVILGVLCMLGMFIFRFPYATMIGALIGFTALIPIAGAYIGAAVGAFMIFTADSLLSALLFVVFIVVLQQIEGNLIYPKVVGASVGLPGIWVLAAITIGGAVGGIFGMLFAVPIGASFYKLLKTDMDERERRSLCTDSPSSPGQNAGSDPASGTPADVPTEGAEHS